MLLILVDAYTAYSPLIRELPPKKKAAWVKFTVIGWAAKGCFPLFSVVLSRYAKGLEEREHRPVWVARERGSGLLEAQRMFTSVAGKC